MKEVHLGDSAQLKVMKGVQTLAEAVGSTMGARGSTVIIQSDKGNLVGGMTVTKDGVTVAEHTSVPDRVENSAIRILKQAARETAESAGDGTTTAIVLAQAIFDNTKSYLTQEHNTTEVLRYIKTISDGVIDKLKEMSVPVEGGKLVDVATISSNNDSVLGAMIAEVCEKVGANGVVSIVDGDEDTYYEVSKGIQFDRGIPYVFQYTNKYKGLAEYDDPYILFTNRKVENLFSIESILKFIHSNGAPLIIIGELGDDAQAAVNENAHKKNIKIANVMPPSMGYRRDEIMRDMAEATGGIMVTEETATDWEIVDESYLGRASKFVASKDTTTLFMSGKEDKVKEIVDSLVLQKSESTNKTDIKNLETRIGILSGNSAKVYVGAETDYERREKRDRVDDAVKATKSAMEMGILPGGGVALAHMSEKVQDVRTEDTDHDIAYMIVSDSLKAPLTRILFNAGIDYSEDERFDDVDFESGIGYNVKTREFGDMIEMGIIDPTKVTVEALRNAVSASCTLLDVKTVITDAEV